MSFDDNWRVADARVASGRVPGYVGAVRVRGHVEIHAAGRTAVEPDSPPMRTDTLFRIASITKPMGGALTLSLVEDGIVSLDDEVARWAPELASPRVLRDPESGRKTGFPLPVELGTGPLEDRGQAKRE